ncbi:MAG: ABC transporter substrate-binding protein [Clostridiaceae bacterium]
MKTKKVLRLAALLMTIIMVATVAVGCGNASTASAEPTTSTNAQPANSTNAAPASTSTKPATGGEILIGVSAAITGAAPLDGERSMQGINMAVEEINANGGVLGKKLKITSEDDQNTSNIAVNVVNKLVANKDIVAVLGPHRSANAMATEQIFADAKMPFLTGASSPNLVTKVNNPYFFRIRGSDSFVGQIIAKFALEKLKATKIGIIYNNDDYGIGGRDVVKEYLTGKGCAPVIMEGHNTGDMDMAGAITKCKDAGINCLIVYTHDPEAAILARQMNELGLDVPVVGPVTFTLPTFLSLVTAEETKGFYSVADFVSGNPDPLASNFQKAFKAKYGVDPDLFAAAYYTGVYILKDAIERAGEASREAIQKALLETKDLPSVYGKLYSNDRGEIVHSAVVTEIVDNKPVYSTTVNE